MGHARPLHRGVVSAFDVALGVGNITDSATSKSYDFHATQISDGTRTIATGSEVSFELAPGGRGRYEAVHIRTVAAASSGGSDGTYPCPVCGAAIEGTPRGYEICESCDWEDDPAQFEDPLSSGANAMTLNEARIAWKQRELRG